VIPNPQEQTIREMTGGHAINSLVAQAIGWRYVPEGMEFSTEGVRGVWGFRASANTYRASVDMWISPDGRCTTDIPAFSSDLAAAFRALGQLQAQGWHWSIEYPAEATTVFDHGKKVDYESYVVTLLDGKLDLQNVPLVVACAPSIPLAICRAILLTTLGVKA
jgi:hypothetical protein